MHTQEEQINHVQSSFEHHANHPHTNFKCYLRTPDMRCKIETICTDQSVSELKSQVKNLLGLDSVVQPSAIKLIVNETELTDDINLALHLFQNAIIHVLVPKQTKSQNHDGRQISIKIKQPPMSCPAYTLQNVPFNLSVKQLKIRIIAFYQQSDESNPIGSLNESGLYLVYGGRILTNDKAVEEYDIDQNGILYVVNGNIYSRQVTREQAEKRIEQVKRGQYTEAQSAEPVSKVNQSNEFPQENSEINEHQDVVFNIIQNIVHDEDSDVEGETANDMSRSQKIIHRYESVNKILPQNNDEEDRVVTEEEVEQTPNIDEAEEKEFKQQISEHLSNLAKKIAEKPEIQGEEQSAQQSTPKSCLQSLVGISNTRVLNSFDEETPRAEGQGNQSHNDVEGAPQSVEDHPDSVPQNNEDDEMLL